MKHIKDYATLNEDLSTAFFLETWIDDVQQLGSDGTMVYSKGKPDLSNKNNKEIEKWIKHLKSLIGIRPSMKKAKKIELRLVDSKRKVYHTVDVTREVTA